VAVVNPAARHGRLHGDERRIVRAFEDANLPVRIERTNGPGHAVEIARTTPITHRAVVAVGGDGTVNEIARGLLARDDHPPLAVLPLGTGNDFGRALGMSMRLEGAVNQLATAVERRVDVGRVHFSEGHLVRSGLFVNAAGIGFDGHVASVAPRYKGVPFGAGYLLSILHSLATWKAVRAVVSDGSDGSDVRLDERCFFMTVGNGRDSGGGFSINPRASIFDGKLDVCFVRGLSRRRALRILPLARRGEHLDLAEIRYWVSKHVRIVPDEPLPLHTDGELVSRSVASLDVLVDPAALRVLMPPPCDDDVPGPGTPETAGAP
jgi:YegS/Rv2252/BmrU family lipid kinase